MGSKTITEITATQTTINDTDNFILQETGGGTSKKTVWSTIKSNLKTYFDTLYSSIPAGTVIESAALTAPAGYLSCNGAAVSRSTYSTLYSAITASLGTVTITSANPGVVSLTGHGLPTGSCVELTTTGVLPTGLSANTNYYVIYVGADSFRLATSAANAIAGTAIDTSGSQSGTHTLRHCPFGISGATNFLLPNRAAVVGVGAGSQTINTRTKTAVLGLVEEDQMQGWQLGSSSDSSGARNTWGYAHLRNTPTGSAPALAGYSLPELYTGSQGYSNGLKAMDNGTDGTPRTGTTTRENRIGMNYYIKY